MTHLVVRVKLLEIISRRVMGRIDLDISYYPRGQNNGLVFLYGRVDYTLGILFCSTDLKLLRYQQKIWAAVATSFLCANYC
mmetsp:Transcript_28319/g.37696  ORF Transcript_28319/g.37696 Transcript_28319/m.37696 type:complete len:81 (+) Transcript_28319:856-1098(+)